LEETLKLFGVTINLSRRASLGHHQDQGVCLCSKVAYGVVKDDKGAPVEA
jgi:hypothetical protein